MSQPRSDFYFAQETLRPKGSGQLGAEDLDRDVAVVLQVFSEIDRRHPARTELALDTISISERSFQAFEGVGHTL